MNRSAFPSEGIAFLSDLKRNNNRDWFRPRADLYKSQVKEPMLALIAAVHREMLKFAPSYVGEPARSLYRIYRDTRFSKDKTPYKTHAGALSWHNALEKNSGAAFYFAVSPEEVAIGGGVYMPSPEVLLAVRTRIAARHAEFRKTFETRPVRRLLGELQGEQGSRTPKGFPADHPADDLLRRKRFFLYTTLPPSVATGPKLVTEVVSRFRAIAPFIDFLDGALLGKDQKSRRSAKTKFAELA